MAQNLAVDLGKMPLGLPLQGTLMRARDYTNQHGHAEITLEHLLLALTEDEDASIVLRASRIDLDRLRDDVTAYISAHGERGPAGMRVEPRISSGLTQILKYASLAAQQGRRPRIDGAIVLAAVVGEGRSTAAGLLKAQGLTFDEAIRALQRSATPAPSTTMPAELQPPSAITHAGGTAVASVRATTDGAVRRAGGTFFDTEDILAAARARVQSREAQVRSPDPAPKETAASSDAPPPAAEAKTPAPVTADAPSVDPGQAAGPTPTAPPRAKPPEMPAAPPAVTAEAAPVSHEPRRLDHDGAAPPPLPAATTAAAVPPPLPTGSGASRPAAAGPPPLPVAATSDAPSATTPPPQAPSWAPPPLPTLNGRGGAGGPPPVPSQGADAPPPTLSAVPSPSPAPMPPQAPPADARARPSADPHRGPPPGPPPHALQQQQAPSQQGYPQQGHPQHGRPPPSGPPPHMLRPGAHRGDLGPGPPVGPPMGADGGRRQAPPRRPAIEPAQVSHAIPARMHAGVARAVEVRIARTPLVAGTPSTQPYAQRGDVASARAISVRLRPLKGAFLVDATSPETQWEKPAGGGRLGGDMAVWRFLVTPQEPGTGELSLHVNAHVMGADGILAETVLPEQIVSVRVAKHLPARLRRWGRFLLAAITGMAVFEALQLASRFGLLAGLRRMIGL